MEEHTGYTQNHKEHTGYTQNHKEHTGYTQNHKENTDYTQNHKERSFTGKAFITSPLVNFDHLKLYSCYRVDI